MITVMVYGLVRGDEEVDEGFYLANEYILNEVFRKYGHYVVDVGGYEDVRIEVPIRDCAMTLVIGALVDGVTKGGYYTLDFRETIFRRGYSS